MDYLRILGIVCFIECGVNCLRDKNRRYEELSASFDSFLSVLDVHDSATTDEDLAVMFLAEVSDTICKFDLFTDCKRNSGGELAISRATYPGILA